MIYVEWQKDDLYCHSSGFIEKESSASIWLASTRWGEKYLDVIRIPKKSIVRMITLN